MRVGWIKINHVFQPRPRNKSHVVDCEIAVRIDNCIALPVENIRERKKLSGIVERGEKYLEGKIGQCDFESETQEKDLLLNYCMYARAGQVDEFIKNYKSEIISLQMRSFQRKAGGCDAKT